ncbi:MAG: hypothetical protein QOG83_2584, partial [Alphaproteobacteria bacterium]|nr:hypothetical protein [Alphaproteobacteria bacterium]
AAGLAMAFPDTPAARTGASLDGGAVFWTMVLARRLTGNLNGIHVAGP